MARQLDMFDASEGSRSHGGISNMLDRFQGAMAFSAVGDALGWPTESGRYPQTARRGPGATYLEHFVPWEKVVGGRYWGYREAIEEGDYSDDTQLMLAVARSINEHGRFEPEKFAYLELPAWLSYERGAGRSVKAAARSFAQARRQWAANFYRSGAVSYWTAGANGAAMRVLPIALVNVSDDERLMRASAHNAITTHGHPRAILGSILYASAVGFTLRESTTANGRLVDYLHDVVGRSWEIICADRILCDWVQRWDASVPEHIAFADVYRNAQHEAWRCLEGVRHVEPTTDRAYYELAGALTPSSRGSGISTVLVAVFLCTTYADEPQRALLTAVNMLGSDTDTIANFVGGLLGARHGLAVVPKTLLERLQDRDYILKAAHNIHEIWSGTATGARTPTAPPSWPQAMAQLLVWEIGLHEMFWDLVEEDRRVVHPVLGRGVIVKKATRPLAREGYVAKLITVSFDCGQTCVFHHRVALDGSLSDSLSARLRVLLRAEKHDLSVPRRVRDTDSHYQVALPTLVPDVDSRYNVDDREAVAAFLRRNADLLPMLQQAHEKIRESFGTRHKPTLRLCVDPEEHFEELLVVVATDAPPAEAVRLLAELDQRWLLQTVHEARGRLNIVVEPT